MQKTGSISCDIVRSRHSFMVREVFKMQIKPTDELNEILEDTKPAQLERYLKDNRAYMTDAPKAFYYYMKDVLNEKRIRLKDVYIAADVSESYGSKIITMEKHTKNRDLIIRLCLAGHFDWKQTDRALKLYGFSELYARNTRDACLIVAINNRMFDLDRVNDMLRKKGLPPLGKE